MNAGLGGALEATGWSDAEWAGLVEGLHPGAAFLGELDLEEVSQSLRLECAVE